MGVTAGQNIHSRGTTAKLAFKNHQWCVWRYTQEFQWPQNGGHGMAALANELNVFNNTEAII